MDRTCGVLLVVVVVFFGLVVGGVLVSKPLCLYNQPELRKPQILCFGALSTTEDRIFELVFKVLAQLYGSKGA